MGLLVWRHFPVSLQGHPSEHFLDLLLKIKDAKR